MGKKRLSSHLREPLCKRMAVLALLQLSRPKWTHPRTVLSQRTPLIMWPQHTTSVRKTTTLWSVMPSFWPPIKTQDQLLMRLRSTIRSLKRVTMSKLIKKWIESALWTSWLSFKRTMTPILALRSLVRSSISTWSQSSRLRKSWQTMWVMRLRLSERRMTRRVQLLSKSRRKTSLSRIRGSSEIWIATWREVRMRGCLVDARCQGDYQITTALKSMRHD